MRKKAGLPEMDPDALPSAYCQKVKICLAKRIKRLRDMREGCPPEKSLTVNQKRKLVKTIYC